jgi:hypothetical protein
MERSFVISVVLILAAAIFAGSLNSDLTGMQRKSFDFEEISQASRNLVDDDECTANNDCVHTTPDGYYPCCENNYCATCVGVEGEYDDGTCDKDGNCVPSSATIKSANCGSKGYVYTSEACTEDKKCSGKIACN